MLFEFGHVWKFLLLVVLSWISYGIWGFEFTIITLLACILAFLIKKRTYF